MIDKAPPATLFRFLVDEFFPAHFKGRSSYTRRTYHTSLDWFEDSLQRRATVDDLTTANLAAFFDWSKGRLADSTARCALQRLRTLWRAAHAVGHTQDEPPAPYWWGSGLPALAGTSSETQPPAELPTLVPLPGPLREPPARPVAYLPIYALERGLTRKAQDQIRYKLASFEKALRRPAEWADFNEVTINTWLAALCEKMASETARSYRAAVLAIWRAAFEARIIDHEPKRIRKVKRRAQRPKAWTLAELDRLLSVCRRLDGQMRRAREIATATFWTAYALVGYYTGLRLADMLALRWSDISPDGILTVVQSKTGDLIACQLPPDVLLLLEKLRGDGRQRVFGDMIGRKGLLEFFKRIVQAAGLPGTSKWLRRSGASHVEALAPGAARGFLGHRSDIGLAYAHYVDPGIDDAAETAAAIDRHPRRGKRGKRGRVIYS